MKLHQLKLFKAIIDNGLNMSQAAESLFTSQPGISKQIKILEEELGIDLFIRAGKHLTGLTPVGEALLAPIDTILHQTNNIYRIADEHKNDALGKLRIATTHTQARYMLPAVINQFRHRYPDVHLDLHQGGPDYIAGLAAAGEADFAISTEALGEHDNMIMMPAYRWNRVLVVPKDHPILNQPLTIETLADYPLVTYIAGNSGRSQLDRAFTEAKIEPNIVLTASNVDIIKTYVREGFGVGIIARIAYSEKFDDDLAILDADHLFNWSTVNIGFRKGLFIRAYMYTFLELFAAHLTQPVVDEFVQAKARHQTADILSPSDLPHF